MTSKNWCFTLNNPTDEEKTYIKNLINDKKIKSIIVEEELGEENTPHLQGYIMFNSSMKQSTLKNMIKRAHLEIAKGSPLQNYKYCTKDNKILIEKGKFPDKGQGRREDLNVFTEKILNEKILDRTEILINHKEIIAKFPRFESRCIESRCEKLLKERKKLERQVIVYYGLTGVGKSRKVREQEEDLYVVPEPSAKTIWWFDGYTGQEAVLFDDFYGGMKYNYLLQITDRYGMQVPVKGGFTWWCPLRIYFTSNESPELWYKKFDNSALMRRITKKEEVLKPTCGEEKHDKDGDESAELTPTSVHLASGVIDIHLISTPPNSLENERKRKREEKKEMFKEKDLLTIKEIHYK